MNPPFTDHSGKSRPDFEPLDPESAARLHRATRRGFVTAGVTLLTGWGAWRWLVTRPDQAMLIWPLRRILQSNERLARLAFRASRLAPTFARDKAVEPPFTGSIGMEDEGGFDPTTWQLRILGGPGGNGQRIVTLDEIRALPRFEQTTQLKCIEGWSAVVHWAGARLADLAAQTGMAARSGQPYDATQSPNNLYEYVSMITPDGGYFVGLDTPSALHPQTLLCYEMNGQPLTRTHGAPLRLVIPVKYGIKNIKRIGTIQFTDRRPADYWADFGYDWYAGH